MKVKYSEISNITIPSLVVMLTELYSESIESKEEAERTIIEVTEIDANTYEVRVNLDNQYGIHDRAKFTIIDNNTIIAIYDVKESIGDLFTAVSYVDQDTLTYEFVVA